MRRRMSSAQRQTLAARRATMGVRKSQAVSEHNSSAFWEDHYNVVKELGAGAFGKVQLVEVSGTRRKRVCKVVDTSQMNQMVLDITRKEISMLRTLDHPYIVKLFEFAEDGVNKELVFLLEFFECGDALDLVEKEYKGAVPEPLTARIIQQLLVAINYCHSRNVVHRDIKPENLMLTKNTPRSDPDCRVIDFGLADTFKDSRIGVGTPAYMPPEVYAAASQVGAKPYTASADLWSIGATAIHLLTGTSPFGKPEDAPSGDHFWQMVLGYRRFSDVLPRLRTTCWLELSEEAQDFCELLLQHNPSKRPHCSDALYDDWLDEHRQTYSGLSRRILNSILSFAEAAPIHKCCAFVLATRADHGDAQEFQEAFLYLDEDMDGEITREELESGLAQLPGHGCGCSGEADYEETFHALDLSHSRRVNYTEFVAACLFGRYRHTDKLVRDAFDSIDTDRDGLVCMDDVKMLFNAGSMSVLTNYLPQSFVAEGDFLDSEDWSDALRQASAEQHRSISLGKHNSRGERHVVTATEVDHGATAGCGGDDQGQGVGFLNLCRPPRPDSDDDSEVIAPRKEKAPWIR